MKPSRDISRLVEIMAALRTPKTGCPWDLEQDFTSISNYTIEEAYEVVDAIEREDWTDLREELGDLLLQSVYHARMAEEAELFDFSDVIEGITEKMIRRHPHVFGEHTVNSVKKTRENWERIKKQEAIEKAKRKILQEPSQNKPIGLLDDIPVNLPALQTAEKLQKKAASVGFDWNNTEHVIKKLYEEINETQAAIASQDKKQIRDEIGDLLFTIANLARHLAIDPDNALRMANRKFRRRFSYIEEKTSPQKASLEEMETLWKEAKKQEKTSS